MFARSLEQGWSLWQPGQEGARGDGGLPVTLHRLRGSLLVLRSLLSQRSLQSRAGKAPLPHAAEGEERLGCQLDTGENSGMKRWFLAVEFHLFPCLLHLTLGISDEEIIAPDIPSIPPKPPFFSTGRLVLAAAALYLLFSFFVKCLQGIFLKSCSSIVGV